MSFRKDFMWGAASAAYQVEGAFDADGKGMSVWDEYCHDDGRIKFNENGDVSCDHYHRYKDDIALMKKIGLKCYRFSVSWTRIIPDGDGKINEKGLDFYSDLVDELIKNDIEPLVTLFHWDYPAALHKKGGWLNDESPEWFVNYAKQVVNRLSDRVKYWITINEPQIFVGNGYQKGVFAPYYCLGNKDLIHISHNILLAHGKTVKMIRETAKIKPMISFSPTGPCFIPKDNNPQTIEEAREKSFSIEKGEGFIYSNRWWSDPVFFGKYPDKAYELFEGIMPDIKDGDMELISQPLDFYGVNLYQNHLDIDINYKQGAAKTQLGWYVSPDLMYWAPKFLYERYGLPVMITENGLACHDWICLDGKVHDPNRIDFIARYLKSLKRAAEDGTEIMGYMYWSVMDNLEWAEGYDPRFGLIYVDYQTLERRIKDSGFWYGKVIESNGEILDTMNQK